MSHQTTLTFMSFNLRVDNMGDGINAFSKRYNRVLDVIASENPDVIGFQEVTDGMRAKLRELLCGYTLQGCGRDANYHGESMLIAYKAEAFELISLENLWLSPTPYVAGSTYGGDQSHCPRMLTTALLKHNDLTAPFRFVNTHFDHKGATARYQEATQLVQLLASYSQKIVLTGDFNALPDSPEIGLISSALAHRGLIDCTANLGGTFHDFGRLQADKKQKIDYIFTDGQCVDAYMVEDTPVKGQYYSDHFAVCAMISLDI